VRVTAGPAAPEPQRLRILVSDDMGTVGPAAQALAADVVVREIDVDEVTSLVAEEAIDVTVVGESGTDAGSQEALRLIDELVKLGICPVVVTASTDHPFFLTAAANAGAYTHTTHLDAVALRSAIDVALQRFDDQVQLKDMMARRVLVERAKGILMERYDLDERRAFAMLRRETRNANLRLDAAAALIVRGRGLLPVQPSVEGA
jgi:response regulator NasT